MDTLLSLIVLIHETGAAVIKMCKLVKQCPIEAARIAMRTQNVLLMLESVAEEFTDVLALNKGLLELRELLENIRVLVRRCKRPARLATRVRRVFGIFAMRDALREVESQLERVTTDLRLPLLGDIKRQLNEMAERADDAGRNNNNRSDGGSGGGDGGGIAGGGGGEIEAAAITEALMKIARKAIDQGMKVRSNNNSSSNRENNPTVEDVINSQRAKARSARRACSPPSLLLIGPPTTSYYADEKKQELEGAGGGRYWGNESIGSGGGTIRSGELIVYLRRVQFEHLQQADILGDGTFGVVRSGVYMGKEVAVKTARVPVQGAAQTLDLFR